MSENSRKISRRAALRAAAVGGAGLLALSTSRLMAAEESMDEEAARYLVYVPRWDFDDATKDAFGDAVGDALAEGVAMDAVLQEMKRGVDLSQDPDARGFDPRTLMGGCVTALALSEELTRRLGPCLLVRFPLSTSESETRSRGVLSDAAKELAKRILKAAPPAPSQTPPTASSGCIIVNVNNRINNVNKTARRGLPKFVKKPWNKVVKPALKAGGKALINEAISKIPGATAAKTLVGRGPAILGLETRPGIDLAGDAPISFTQPIVVVW